MKADPKDKGEGLLIGVMGEPPRSTRSPGREPKGEENESEQEEDDEDDSEGMKQARHEALRAFKSAMDGDDLEAADEALQDYLAAQE